jgi:hypothetical protein
MPNKLARHVKSYQVETSFLTSKACQYLVDEAGLKLNKVIGMDVRPADPDLGPAGQLESRFGIFFEYFHESDGWKKQWLLNEQASKAALAELAKMHAYFWQGSQFWNKENGVVGRDLESIVWPNGGYMQPNFQGKQQQQDVTRGWEAQYPIFQADLEKIPELECADLQSLGKRLFQVAPRVGQNSHPFSGEGANESEFLKYKTLIHGNPTQANFFFRPTKLGDLEVGVIDFQWSGFGLAGTDVAHHIASAVMPAYLSLDGQKESDLLDHYHECLSQKLVKFGVASNELQVEQSIFPRAILQVRLFVLRRVFSKSKVRLVILLRLRTLRLHKM